MTFFPGFFDFLNQKLTLIDIFRLHVYSSFMRLKFKILYVIILFQLVIPGALLALEPAPDITDREVVEKLSKIEAGQQSLNHRISDLRSEMKSGQEALRSEMKSGQEALRSEMKSGQEALSKRLDDSNNTMLVLFGSIITLIVALFGYIAWDRRTMMKPVLERVERIEHDVAQSLDLSNTDGSKLSRVINAMRELAKTDEQLATILRSFSLL